MSKALIIVDVQNDFCPSGALPVPEGDQIIPLINLLIEEFDCVVFTADTHPKNHCSFKENGGIWPVHCVNNTEGHKLHKDLNGGMNDLYILKGQNSKADSYSGFCDNDGTETMLASILKAREIEEVFICGLAYEYCVAFTAKDAIKYGFKTFVVSQACKAITKEGAEKATKEMKELGIEFIFE